MAVATSLLRLRGFLRPPPEPRRTSLRADAAAPEDTVQWRRHLPTPRKLCPSCLGLLREVGTLSGWLAPPSYECASCGYEGPVALEAAGD
jgi:hypothetical protein